MLLGLGRREKFDVRDENYQIGDVPAELRKAAEGKPRRYRYWNEGKTRVNQGSVPACVGAAWVHYLINGPVKQDPKLIPNFIDVYRMAQDVDEWPGNNYAGTSVRAGAKVFQQLGFIQNYFWGWSVEQAADAILNIGPVVAGTIWTRGMSYPDKEGIIRVTGQIDGGHAYLVNGVNLDKAMFRMEQSWFPSWGATGNAFIPFEEMEKLFSADAECCLPTEIRKAA